MLTPALHPRNLQLRTLLGVEEAKQVGDEIVGRFKDELTAFEGKREGRLIDKFLNWPDDTKSILRFTRKYGPLEIAAKPKNTFRFPEADFRSAQQRLGKMWRSQDIHPEKEIKGGTLLFRQGTVTYSAPTLFMYLYVDLVTLPIDRVKICKRDGCVHPFFIAGHLKQRFCSDECAEVGQRELKKEWWDKNGAAWRANRRNEAKTEEDKGGIKKTR
jgi:hypothetical protein